MEQEIINIFVGIMGFITGICVADLILYSTQKKDTLKFGKRRMRMKSLEIIKNRAKKYDFFNSPSKFMLDLSEEEWNDLIRDLEVLEIIRKSHLGDDDIFIRFLIASYMDIDEYNKVKQWLEEQE